MHEALSLLFDLTPQEIDLLISNGTEREVHRGDLIIEEGKCPDGFYIILEGLVEVRLDSARGRSLGVLGPGELLGEVSWLEDAPASATVRAAEDGVLLGISHQKLAELLSAEGTFSAHFYRSLGRVLARRLRARSLDVAKLGLGGNGISAVKEMPAWQAIEPAIDGMKEMMLRAEKLTRKSKGTPPDELFAQTHAGFDQLCTLLTQELGPDADIDDPSREEVGALVRREMHPYMMLTRIVERIYTKPRGYAGDFLTIQWMYENQTGGIGAAGQLIDAAFLERPAARAVRNRRQLLANEIKQAIERGGQVASLACGPAEELFDVFAEKGNDSFKATCLDIDLQALAQVSDRRDEEGLKLQMRLEQANLVYLATGRSKLELPPQDLIYSIGLIDYFQDRFVVALLDWIYDCLAPGGKVILGNFHPSNPDRALMDHVLDWRLIHRDEDDMNRIFSASKFASKCSEIRKEPAQVNLFAMAVK
ncbi:MAG: cyclic nucleotide-binding domain-containing protein [Planctomycetes bacterium]|nr:cyclic nucleotide-binding domain-containing protein [Planctomycetota bacterium]